jgi:cytochrome c-type biogenesis protein
VEVYVGAFAAGIGATVTPCILPLYPAFLAYVTGGLTPLPDRGGHAPLPDRGGHAPRTRPIGPARAALLVWTGVVVGMVAIGAALAALAAPLGDFNAVVLPVADLLLITLGVVLLLGINPFARLPQPSPSALGGHGAGVGAFLYGLLFAPIAVPCSGPFLIGIFAFSLTIADALGRLLFFGVFGIGFGLPLFVLGSLGHVRGRQIASAVVRHERPLQLVMGIALVAVGAWDLWVNLPNILASA